MRDPYAPIEQADSADPNARHPMEYLEPLDDGITFSLAEFCRAISFIINEMKTSRKPLQSLDCFALATDLAVYYGENGQTIADRHGISRQRVNVVVQEYQQELGIAGGVNSKRADASEAYRLNNKRNTKCPA